MMAAATATACGSDGGVANQDQITFKYATYQPENSTDAKVAKWWFERVDELTPNHELDVKMFYSGSLLPPDDTLNGVASRRADAALFATSYHPKELPLSQIATVPFLSTSAEASARVHAEMYENNEAFREEFKRNGLVPLVWAVVPNNTLGFVDPVDSVDDLDGKKIRAVGISAQALEAKGAEVVALPATDLYESLEQGVIEGFSTLIFTNAVLGFNVAEVAPNLVDSGLGQYVLATQVVMNADLYEGLPDEVKGAMGQAAEEALDFSLKETQAEGELACDRLQELGGSVTTFPEDEVSAWKDGLFEGLLDQWSESASESPDLTEDAIEEFESEYLEAMSERSGEAAPDILTECANRG
ncbi:C4-dicarboxylate TRAP transporter substrate-binding protein [Nocardioides seonyuensis]|nr:C4-dicarboxylate TRAP transporter substrate-binding protein [Nocardioides seonyuensis]